MEKTTTKINSILNEYQKTLQLRYLESPKKDTKNYIAYAYSEIYGDVVIKFVASHWEFLKEVQALALYNGISVCKCFEADYLNQSLVLERIMPGNNLHTVFGLQQRLEIFIDLLERLTTHIKPDMNLPEHRNVFERVSRKAAESPEKYKELLCFIELAKGFYECIELANMPQYFLHGDLNHRNILMGTSLWTAIDPLGVIGDKCFEPPRFIRNEITIYEQKDRLKQLDIILDFLSDSLCEKKETMARAFLIDQVCTACWQIESNASPSLIKEEIQTLKLINPYVQSLR